MNLNCSPKPGSLGYKLRALREQKLMTLRQFASLIGASPTWVSCVQRNEIRPSESQLKLVARVLGVEHQTEQDLITQNRQEIAEFLSRGECPACSGTGEVTRRSEWSKGGGPECSACGGTGEMQDTSVRDWLFYVRCCEGGEALYRYHKRQEDA